MLCTNFKDCNDSIETAICGVISYLTYFINKKCYGKYQVVKPIQTISDGKIKSVDYIYTDCDNDLMIHYTDGEAELWDRNLDVIYEIVSFLKEMEEMFA